MKKICQSNYERETSEQEYRFVQQQIQWYNSPIGSFQFSPIAHSPLIDSVDDRHVRQELFKQYKDIAEQSRVALFNVYLKSTEDQRKDYKEIYENDFKKMISNNHEKLTPTMVQLISERCHKISERIHCIYQFKVQSLLSKSRS